MIIFEYLMQEMQYYQTFELNTNYYAEKFISPDEAKKLTYAHKERLTGLLSQANNAITHINYLIDKLNSTVGTASINCTVYPQVYSKYSYSFRANMPACNSKQCKDYFNVLIDLKAIYLRFIGKLEYIINAYNILIKGYIGEEKIINKLSFVDGTKLHNVFLEFEGKLECEIDHLLINQHGVFIIETKNWSGQITVDVDGATLKGQKGRDQKRVNKNPIDQVNKCALSLKKFIRYNCPEIADTSFPIHTIVVFSDDESRLECKRSAGLTKIVLIDTLFESIREIEQEFAFVLDEASQKNILAKINKHNNVHREFKFQDFLEPLRIPNFNYAYSVEDQFFTTAIKGEDIITLKNDHIVLYYTRVALEHIEKLLKQDKDSLTGLFDRIFLNNKRKESQWVPVILSIIPGFGQLYNGQSAKGLLFFLPTIILMSSSHSVYEYLFYCFYVYNLVDAYLNSK